MTQARDAMIGIMGATGAVGRTMLQVLEERRHPPSRVRLVASDRSAGQTLPYGGAALPVVRLGGDAFDGLDVALFALDDAMARTWVPRARDAGVTVVDNSAAFRMDPNAPLVVPEVNGHLLQDRPGLVANPNCSTIVAVLALAPLAAAAGLRRVVAVSFQSASGAGAAAEAELRAGTEIVLEGGDPPAEVFAKPLAFDCHPQIGSIDGDGHAREERKMRRETRRILDLPDLPVSVTCVRVPTLVSHGVALHVETDRPLSRPDAMAALARAPGVIVGDGRDPEAWPTPRDAAGRDEVFVGRVRAEPDWRGLALWAVGDNLRKGAATNAIQIADALLGRS